MKNPPVVSIGPSGLGGEYQREIHDHRPSEAMVNRIKSMFYSTWGTIAGDIRDSLVEQAKMGDKAAKAALKRNGLSRSEAFEMCVDYIRQYGHDAEAYAAYEAWRAMDRTKSRAVCIKLCSQMDFSF